MKLYVVFEQITKYFGVQIDICVVMELDRPYHVTRHMVFSSLRVIRSENFAKRRYTSTFFTILSYGIMAIKKCFDFIRITLIENIAEEQKFNILGSKFLPEINAKSKNAVKFSLFEAAKKRKQRNVRNFVKNWSMIFKV